MQVMSLQAKVSLKNVEGEKDQENAPAAYLKSKRQALDNAVQAALDNVPNHQEILTWHVAEAGWKLLKLSEDSWNFGLIV